MRNIFILISPILFFTTFLNAQLASDALRFSQIDVSGTARSIGIGGAISALGSDYSVLSTNPAGLATYRKSELVLTPSLTTLKNSATQSGDGNLNAIETSSKFGFDNFGLVFHKAPRSTDWKSFNVGIGLNKIANYTGDVFYDGASAGSLADSYAELADGLFTDELDGFSTQLAYQTGAIYLATNDNDYTTDFEGFETTSIQRRETIVTTGGINEMVLSFAGNYDNRLSIGTTIGIPLLRWQQNRTYNEEDPSDEDNIPFFNSLDYEEEISTEGIGINLKLGLIYRINKIFRFGLAAHTPTAYSLTDRYFNSLTYDFTDANNDGAFTEASPTGTFAYRLNTPWRYIGSAAAVIGKIGFVSAEVEWVDYSTASFNFTKDINNSANQDLERQINNSILNSFDSALNIRLGAEYAYKIFRLRGGFNISGSPFVDDNNTQRAVSFGVGLREKHFYIDLAYRRLVDEEVYSPYFTVAAPQPTVAIDRNQNKYALTLGFRF